MNDLRRALRYFRPEARRLALVFLLLAVNIGLGALKPWPLALIVDCVLQDKPWPRWLGLAGPPDKPSALAALSLALLGLWLAQAAIAAGQNYLSIAAGLRGLTRVRRELFERLQRLSLRFHQGARAGDLIYRASWDTYAFQTLFQQGLMTFAGAALSLAVMAAVMARMNVTLTLLALGLAPALAAIIPALGGVMNARAAAARQADSLLTSSVQQNIAALALTQSCGREEHEAARFQALADAAQKRRLGQHGWELLYALVVTALFGLATAALTWLGGRQALAGRLTIGEWLVFLSYLIQLYEPLNQLSNVGSTVAGAMAGTRRVFEILDAPEEIADRPGARPPAAVRGEIQFDGVCFEYEPGRPTLRDVSFTLRAGETAAIIGPNGAGKTTLLHLVARFFDPASGAVRLDGVDLRDLSLRELRAQIAFVFQEPVILPGDVAENIAYGRSDATAEEIEAAARAANADAFIQRLPEKYRTRLGEGATRLSAGERQRISLARVFLRQAPIVLLDEPAAALDAESARLMAESLERLLQGRTALMVAHSHAAVARFPRALVLEDGRVTAFGTPAELARAGGYFARMAATG